VSTCFIFFDALNYTPDAELPALLWATRLDESGEVDIALSEHTPDAIAAMSMGVYTVVVLPAAVASIYCLDLPKLSLKKAREAIPYALEEMLAEPVQAVHVAFDRDAENTLQYRTVVLNKLRLNTWISALEALGISFDAMTLDWFALKPNEVCVTNTDVLVHDAAEEAPIYGALSPSIAADYLKRAKTIQGFVFDDSVQTLPGVEQQTGAYRLWIASRLLTTKVLNICQGQFQQKAQTRKHRYWGWVCAGLLATLFFCVIAKNVFLLHQLHAKQAVIAQDIQTIYMRFFPEATQVISPRFRIEKLLEANGADSQSPFWFLLDKLSQVYLKHPHQFELIESIAFHDEVIVLRLVTENFEALEAIEQQLKMLQVSVKQLEASTRSDQVFAILELQS
jgi:general secretion pathway protein L